jgi:hypothetical protein
MMDDDLFREGVNAAIQVTRDEILAIFATG